jgi:uncharacterized protein YcbK (DUF882 family)
MAIARRHLLGLGLGAMGAGLLGSGARAAEMPARTLSFLNTHTGEKVKATYWAGGRYLDDAVAEVNRILRDFRTGDVHPMDLKLLDKLTVIRSRLEVSAPIQIISGYRSPASNAKLAARSGQVAKHSLHMDGQAIDIRVEGVDLDRVHKAALGLGEGGVGFYPASNFVHVDTGRTRRWQGS